VKSLIKIAFQRCKECGYCIEFCPQGVLIKGRKLNSNGYYPPVITNIDKCLACGTCARVCPDAAISIYKDN
jgi:2-oxoglutarate ferredoxin oxidoreductase subunit delta